LKNMFFEIITLFPAMFEGSLTESIVKRAQDKGLVSIRFVNFRDFADDNHHTVDDTPYGGDPGMLLKPEPLAKAIADSKRRLIEAGTKPLVVCMSAQGSLLTHKIVEQLSCEQSIILVCGHYKGIDQRIIDAYVDMELSVGDYVLSGGEIPAMIVVDAVTRLLPGVLGNPNSAGCDSFFKGLLGCPQYTRPEVFEGREVPKILLSGHHANISVWQKETAIQITKKRRPDLWEKYKENNN